MPKYEGMEKKTLKLEEKMSEIEARLAELIKLKAEYEKKLTDSQNTQIVYLARQSNLTLDEMKEIFAVFAQLKAANMTIADITELVGADTQKNITEYGEKTAPPTTEFETNGENGDYYDET